VMVSGILQIFMKGPHRETRPRIPNVCQSWYDIKMGVGLWNSIFEIKRPER